MTRSRARLLALLTLLVLALLTWWLWPQVDHRADAQVLLAVHNRPRIQRPVRKDYARPAALDQAPEAPADPHEVEQAAVRAAWPDKQLVRCAADGLEPGLLTVRPTVLGPGGTVFFAASDGAEVVAVVDGERGEGIAHLYLSPVARLTWSVQSDQAEGTCRVHDLRTHTLRGTVIDHDGRPVADAEVRGCIHGDIARTDAGGGFATTGIESTRCYPMAFLDRDGLFARSTAPEVLFGTAPPPPVELQLEEGWTPERQLATMEHMARLLERSANGLTANNPALLAAVEATDPLVAQVLWNWGGQEQARHDQIWDDLERLTLDEDPYVAFRDVWLNQY